MAFIVWKDSYALGVKKIDAQHRSLLTIMNEMFQIFLDKKMDEDHFKMVSDQLRAYGNLHFTTEQDYFLQADYDKRELHTAIHDQMRHHIEELGVKYSLPGSNKEALFFELSDFMRNMWIWHVNGMDREYVPCLHEHNIF